MIQVPSLEKETCTQKLQVTIPFSDPPDSLTDILVAVFLTFLTYILSEALQSRCTTLSSQLWLAGHQYHQKEENNGKDPSLAHLSE